MLTVCSVNVQVYYEVILNSNLFLIYWVIIFRYKQYFPFFFMLACLFVEVRLHTAVAHLPKIKVNWKNYILLNNFSLRIFIRLAGSSITRTRSLFSVLNN